ncbi:hypothetical protein KAU45_00700 [bacterium]|nr:hypothetical protein [bacterium]
MAKSIDEKSLDLRWGLTASIIFIALIISTSLKQIYPPEPAVNSGYFLGSPPFTDTEYLNDFPDLGYLVDKVDTLEFDQKGLTTDWKEVWKYGANWNDAVIYMGAAKNLTLPQPPYRYRPLVPFFAGLLNRFTGLPIPLVFLIINGLSVLGAALIFFEYLHRFHGFKRLMSLLGGCLFVVSSGVTGTLAYPLIEPVTYLLIMLIFWSVRTKNKVMFLTISLAGVLTKGVLAIGGALYLFINYKSEDKFKKNIPVILTSLVPIVLYMLIRVVLGGSIDEVSSGFRLLQGEIPIYAFRILRWSGLIEILGKIFVSFSLLWIGLLTINRDHFLRLAFFVVGVPIICAAILFSSDIARPLGILYPIVIPLFLIFVRGSIRKELPGLISKSE